MGGQVSFYGMHSHTGSICNTLLAVAICKQILAVTLLARQVFSKRVPHFEAHFAAAHAGFPFFPCRRLQSSFHVIALV